MDDNPQPPDIPIRDLTRLDLKPGEVLLVRIPDNWWTPANGGALSEFWRQHFPNNEVLVAPATLDVLAIRTDVTQQEEVNDAAAAAPR